MRHHIFSSPNGTNPLTQEICNILRDHQSNHRSTPQIINETIRAIQYNPDTQSIVAHLVNLRATLPHEDQALEPTINSWIHQNNTTDEEPTRRDGEEASSDNARP